MAYEVNKIRKEKENKKRYGSWDEEGARYRRQLVEWYVSRFSDEAIDRINSLPTFEQQREAAQAEIDRIMEEDCHNPDSPRLPPPR